MRNPTRYEPKFCFGLFAKGETNITILTLFVKSQCKGLVGRVSQIVKAKINKNQTICSLAVRREKNKCHSETRKK